MIDDKEKVKDDVLKNPKHILVCIQFLVIQGKPIWEAYKDFCETLGDDVMEYKDFDFWWYRFKNGECDVDYDRSKEPKKRKLGDMPIKVVKKIIGKLEKEERYALPNVSKSIRNVMEDANLFLSNLSFYVCDSSIMCNFNGRNVEVEYASRNVSYVCEKKIKKQVTGDLVTVATRQLTRILKNPALRFDDIALSFEAYEFLVSAEQLFNGVLEVFQSMSHQIHVKNLKIEACSLKQPMAFLSYLKPGVLESIFVHAEEPIYLEEDQFAELDQFKQAKSFKTDNMYFDAPIDSLFHFNSIETKLPMISVEDVNRLKDAFLASPDFECCQLEVKMRTKTYNQLKEAFDGKVFAIPDSNDSLQIDVTSSKLSINRVFKS